ncbi:hypothetical protein ES703_30899 [subsurface metagenome]
MGGLDSVDLIPDHGKADCRQVHPYLVGAPGFGHNLEQGVAADIFNNTILCAGFPARCHHRHFLAVVGVTADIGFDNAVLGLQPALDQRQIGLGHGMGLELPGKVGLSGAVLSHQHHARGIFIQAVDDTGAQGVADISQVGEVSQDGVDQGMGGVARGGVDGQTGRLIDDEEVIVFVDNFEGNRLGFQLPGRGGGNINVNPVAGIEPEPGFGRLPVDGDIARGNELLHPCAGKLGYSSADIFVEAGVPLISGKAI